MRVATAFSEEVAATFGPEKLDRALRYIARTPEDEKPSDIPELRIAVPQDDGAVAQKPFADVTVAELRRAIQVAAGAQGQKKARAKSNLPEAAAAALTKANKALDTAVGLTRLLPRAGATILAPHDAPSATAPRSWILPSARFFSPLSRRRARD